MALCIAEHLVSGTKAAGGLQAMLRQLTGKRLDLGVQASEDLLTVAVSGRDRPHPGAEDAECGLVQVHDQGLGRRAACRRSQCSKHRGVMPFPWQIRNPKFE